MGAPVTGAPAPGDRDLPVPCADDPELWFSLDADDHAKATTICRTRCHPAQQQACLEGALQRHERAGVWGGLLLPASPTQQAAARARIAAAKARKGAAA
jgi:Transcription factor WhiB